MQLVRVPRLGDVAVDAAAVDGVDDGADVGVAGEQQANGIRMGLAHVMQQLDARHLRHPLVGHHHVDRFLREDADALAGARGAQDAVVEPEEIADALHHVGLVVDDEDAVPPRRLHPWVPHVSLDLRARRGSNNAGGMAPLSVRWSRSSQSGTH